MDLVDVTQDLQGIQPPGAVAGGHVDTPWLTKWY